MSKRKREYVLPDLEHMQLGPLESPSPDGETCGCLLRHLWDAREALGNESINVVVPDRWLFATDLNTLANRRRALRVLEEVLVDAGGTVVEYEERKP